MQVETKKIVKFCEDYLKVKNFEDFCLNGLQVEGAQKVSKIITGVSLSKELIEVAIKKRVKMIIVHHGLFNNMLPPPIQIKGVVKDRLKLLLENNINLLGFHLPLDAHSVIGNNISLCKLLGVKNAKLFHVGYIGDLAKPMKFKEFAHLVNSKLGIDSYVIPAGPKAVKKVGIISGGSSPNFNLAKELEADTYICGDIREEVVRAIEEAKINFINAGHYNTEKLGVQNLGNLIAKKFNIKVEFVDIPCNV